ncbi:ribonuclease HII [Terriglobus roseus]|uniref:Ribonuclease HII n=1 Tax=Terriglobus roseus TaxID=392734 RepID=A0A1H4J1L2_9BACT|nr:ribonuclease HII [Terriglobus roseus]SEB40164.1 RNase HII [Terriglobus roseus]
MQIPLPMRRKRPMIPEGQTKQQMLRDLVCSDAPEQALRYHGFCCIAGVDEVGRGALFGSVVAAAVVLPERTTRLQRLGLRDSKQLTREEREQLDHEIRKCAIAFAVGEVDAETIDRINIYQASRLAMRLAVEQLGCVPDHLLIDAMRIDHSCAQTKLIYGDSLSVSIAAASVLAKVHRDAQMREWDLTHPQYGLASHKGYATPEHRRALEEHGPTPLHRKSFAPVARFFGDEALEQAVAMTELLFDEAELQEEFEPCQSA